MPWYFFIGLYFVVAYALAIGIRTNSVVWTKVQALAISLMWPVVAIGVAYYLIEWTITRLANWILP